MSKHLIKLGESIASGSNCLGQKVGAIIFDLNNPQTIISHGCNISTQPCIKQGYCHDRLSCVESDKPSTAIHAEVNAIMFALKHEINLENTGIYITQFPCLNCIKLICMSGIKHIFLREEVLTDERFKEDLEFAIKHFLLPFGVQVKDIATLNKPCYDEV